MKRAEMTAEFAPLLAGKFIVLDGPDGGGKTTQLAMLSQLTRAIGCNPCLVRAPGSTKIGAKLRALLLDVETKGLAPTTEMLLFVASQAQVLAELVTPAIASGRLVLADRWVASTFAYQGADFAHTKLRKLNELVFGSAIWPDLTIILDVSYDVAQQRREREPDRMEIRSKRYHTAVRKRYLEYQKTFPMAVARVDAEATVQEVTESILRVVLERMRRSRSKK